MFFLEVEFNVIAGKLTTFTLSCRKVKMDYVEAKKGHKTDSGKNKILDCDDGYTIISIKCDPEKKQNVDPPEYKVMSMCQKITPPKKSQEKKPHKG